MYIYTNKAGFLPLIIDLHEHIYQDHWASTNTPYSLISSMSILLIISYLLHDI